MSLVGIDDDFDVQSVTRPRARKSYKCDECRRQIMPGEVYRRDFTVYMGDAATWFSCSDCDALMGKFFAAIPKEYRSEFTFETGHLTAAILELRDEYGATIPGYEYPSAEIIPLNQ